MISMTFDTGKVLRSILLLIILFLLCIKLKAQYQHGEGGKYIEINGAKLWVEMIGQGEPIFLIAGGPAVSHVYLHSFDTLKNSNLLIYVDFYGRGKSDVAQKPRDYTF